MMRPSSILFMICGLIFMAVVYLFNRMSFVTWNLVYYITMGFLAFMAIFYQPSRWPFIWGLCLGFVALVILVKFGYLPKGMSSLPF